MTNQAVCFTAADLAERGKEHIPPELISGTHLIYSSPATLAFNSPGAEGFGVKRAGLAVPESVMLIVAPGCCGRNTSLISDMPDYRDRFFYLTMDETDVVTGRHLKKIPGAVKEVVDWLEQRGKRPAVVMICITCVDALLGTDMERVCRRAAGEAGLPVRPCYMYALTREGRKPPMVYVRESIYSLLEPIPKKSSTADLLGFFAPLLDTSELYELLKDAGIKTIREISRCRDFEEYKKMAEANFALILHPEARAAAQDFEQRLQIPSIELTRFYDIDRIHRQYQALGQVLGTVWDDSGWYERAAQAIKELKDKYPKLVFAVGECLNADPFELSLALVKMGFAVEEIFGTLTAENFIYLKQLARYSPQTKVYSNLHPTMIHYPREETAGKMQVCLGKDAAYYHPAAPAVHWNSDRQPYGYDGVIRLLGAISAALCDKRHGSH